MPLQGSVYIGTNTRTGSFPLPLATIKNLRLTLDNQVVFDGSTKQYSSFWKNAQQSGAPISGAEILYYCRTSFQMFCSRNLESYAMTTYTFLGHYFTEGKHTLRAKITLSSDAGNITL
jgi:hypothetical protein